jgi:glycosyltransferase involved in cell wall biosynthesis
LIERRIAIFGSYSDHDLYQRNRILVELIEELSEDSIRIRPDTRTTSHGFSAGQTLMARLRRLFSEAKSLWSQRHRLKGFDTIFVPYPAYLDVLCLWFLGLLRGRRLIVDAFLELHSTVVEDRAMTAPGSLRAGALRAFQRFTLSKADLVLIDTPQQAEILRQELRSLTTEVRDIPVGIDEGVWTPMPMPPVTQSLKLLFWGTFIPLHGVEHIVAAARLLEERGSRVQFQLIGDGQTADDVARELAREPPSNLHWTRKLIDSDSLRRAIGESHLVLGIFGNSAKAASVVPYKVHQALASNRPVVSRESECLNALADSARGLVLCPPANPVALADAIDMLCSEIRREWVPGTREIYESHFSRMIIKQGLVIALDSVPAA